MGIFKRKQNDEEMCCCDGACSINSEISKETSVKILGSGCSKCNQLEKATVEALKELGMGEEVEHVTDFVEIASYGVMSTPALVFNNKVLSYGKVLKREEVIDLIKKAKS